MKQKAQKKRSGKNAVAFIKAHRLKVPNHPPDFMSVPWNPLVVRMNNPTGIVDHGALYNAITTQLAGLSFTGSIIVVRLQSVRIWGPIPTTNTPLNVRFYDLFDEVAGSTPAGNLALEEMTDYADQVNRARVGYCYSSAQQQKALLVTTGSNDKIMYVTGAGAGSVAYFHLMWRPFSQGAPPQLLEEESDYDDLSDRRSRSTPRKKSAYV